MPAFLFTLEETLVSGWNISHKIDRSVQVGLGLSSPWQFDAIILQKKISLCSQYWFVFFPPVLPLSRLKKQLIAVSNWNWTSMGNSPWIHGSTFDQWDLTKLILITWLARGRTQLGTFFHFKRTTRSGNQFGYLAFFSDLLIVRPRKTIKTGISPKKAHSTASNPWSRFYEWGECGPPTRSKIEP